MPAMKVKLRTYGRSCGDMTYVDLVSCFPIAYGKGGPCGRVLSIFHHGGNKNSEVMFVYPDFKHMGTRGEVEHVQARLLGGRMVMTS